MRLALRVPGLGLKAPDAAGRLDPGSLDPRLLIYRFHQTLEDLAFLRAAERDLDPGDHEGSYPLVVARVLKFYAVHRRHHAYEPVRSFDELRKLVLFNDRLMTADVPEAALVGAFATFKLFQSAFDAREGLLPMPSIRESEVALHSVLVDGGWRDGGETLRFLNSWGEGWGDHGYGLLTRSYAEQFMTEAWSARRADIGATRATIRRIEAATTPEELHRAWMARAPRFRVSVRCRGRRYFVVHFDWISVSGGVIDAIELLDARGVRIGWSHSRHFYDRDTPVSEVQELFVWPWFRGNGYGKWLERLAQEKALEWGVKEMRILYHEADVYGRLPRLFSAEQFARKAGYSWEWKYQSMPRVVAVATKILQTTPRYRARVVRCI